MRESTASPAAARALLFGAAALALVLLLPYLETVPGLHGDEAWVGLRVRALSEGHHTVYGMNAYTGSVHQYLLLPFMQLLGYRVAVLRGFSVATSLISLLLYFSIVRRLFGARAAGIAALLLASLPFFTLYGRTATENFALNPVCALGACRLLLAARDRTGRRRVMLALAAGALLALATWSHIIFLPVPALLALAALLHLRLRLLRSPVFVAAAMGFFIALAPRLVAQVVLPPEQSALAVSVQRARLLHLLPVRLLEWPGICGGIVHGDLLYQRYTGEVAWPTPPIGALLFAVSLLAALHAALRRTIAQHRQLLALLGSLPALFLMTIALAPESADRYQLLIVYYAPLFLALLLERLFTARAPPLVGTTALLLLVALNVARTTIDFYAAHLRTGGLTSAFRLGLTPLPIDAKTMSRDTLQQLFAQRLAETSNHFVRTDRLYRELVLRQVEGLFTEFMIAMPLFFYDLDQHHFQSIVYPDLFIGRDPSADLIDHRPQRIVVTYGGGLRWLVPEQWGATRPLFRFEQFQGHGFSR
ncbi:MAG: glycosyltransferase family 39 protein [Planctomycetota bacterium]